MSEFSVDIAEVISFINCIDALPNSQNLTACLDAFTALTGEGFLDERAKAVRGAVQRDSETKAAFEHLSAVCAGKCNAKCEECVVRKYCNTYINNARENATAHLKIVDLFCGAGGLSLGFVQEGFCVALANDIEACCVDTYAHNHPETPRDHIIKGDIREVVEELERLIDGEPIDIVVGGPPCQGFSMANRQRLIDDPRNYLYKNYIEVVHRLQPKFFVMENVKGMLGVSNQVKEDFEAIGYTVECKVFNAKNFGVPQNRERLIYIGNRIGVDNGEILKQIEMIGASMASFVLSDALYGLRPLQASRVRNATEIDSDVSGSIRYVFLQTSPSSEQ